MTAREPSRPAELMDRVQLLAVASALMLDAMVLGSMVARIGDLGRTPNRVAALGLNLVAALGLNLVLLVDLDGAAWPSVRCLEGRTAFHRLERWQTSYLPSSPSGLRRSVVALPPLFAFG